MSDPLEIAVEARERANGAHKRLDTMNGSIDKLRDEVAQARRDIVAGSTAAKSQSEEILRQLSRNDGRIEGAAIVSRGLLDSKRFWITTIVLLATSSFFSLLITLAFRGHTP